MSDPQNGPAIPSATIPLAEILGAISNPVRWSLMCELASGEQLMVIELAERIGQSLDSTSKHMVLLRNAGIVTQGAATASTDSLPSLSLTKLSASWISDTACCG